MLLARSKSAEGTVKVRSVVAPSGETFWTIMSTLILASASGPKIAAAMPGLSSTRRMEIWSDGKVYPVVVIPQGVEKRTLAGKRIDVLKFSIRGIDVPDRDRWKGRLDLWLARDEASTPVEILISRNLADVRMELAALQ